MHATAEQRTATSKERKCAQILQSEPVFATTGHKLNSFDPIEHVRASARMSHSRTSNYYTINSWELDGVVVVDVMSLRRTT